jgi:hypothetical protein
MSGEGLNGAGPKIVRLPDIYLVSLCGSFPPAAEWDSLNVRKLTHATLGRRLMRLLEEAASKGNRNRNEIRLYAYKSIAFVS